jgi:hypothetical protein
MISLQIFIVEILQIWEYFIQIQIHYKCKKDK